MALKIITSLYACAPAGPFRARAKKKIFFGRRGPEPSIAVAAALPGGIERRSKR